MRSIPFGYEVVGGKIQIKVEEAEKLKQICENYLSGMAFVASAKAVGLTMNHGTVKKLLMNQRYLGDEVYPAILTKETVEAIEAERIKRANALGRNNMPRKTEIKRTATTEFTIPRIVRKYEDPIQQAEYAYKQIREVRS